MKMSKQTATILAAIAIFIGLPLMFYAMGDAPRRSVLKEVISVLTLLAFSMMIGQFFMARSNTWLLSVFKPPQIQKVHKYIAYSAVAAILAHPALIVVPRFFEGGVRPLDALITMVTTFDNLGLMMGFFAYLLLLVLTATAFCRRRLIPRFSHGYRGWRYSHGALAVGFTGLGLWHAIALGRHTDLAMSALFVTLAVVGVALLVHLYRGAPSPKPASQSRQTGATS